MCKQDVRARPAMFTLSCKHHAFETEHPSFQLLLKGIELLTWLLVSNVLIEDTGEYAHCW